MKKMGLDFGKARIGIALSDSLGFLASPYCTLKRTSLTDDVVYIKNLIDNNSVDTLVVGMPLQMNGEKGDIAIEVENFCKELSNKIQIPIIYEDERLTSYEAEEYLKKTIKDWKKRKELIDQVSASIILQTYLDKK